MKGTFNDEEEALVGAFSVITYLRMNLFQAGGCLLSPAAGSCRQCTICMLNIAVSHAERGMAELYTLGKVDGSKGGKLGVDIFYRRLIYVELLKTGSKQFQ